MTSHRDLVSWEGGLGHVHTIRVLRLRGVAWLDMFWGEGLYGLVSPRESVGGLLHRVWGDACCLA